MAKKTDKPAEDPKTRQNALAALAANLGNMAPLPLHGTKAKPGFFMSSSASAKAAAALAIEKGWLEETEEKDGKGKSAKSLYVMTADGLYAVLVEGETASAVRSLMLALDEMRTQLQSMSRQLVSQRKVVDRLYDVIVPPELTNLVYLGEPSVYRAEHPSEEETA